MLTLSELKIANIGGLGHITLVRRMVEQRRKALVVNFYTYQRYMGYK